MILHEQHGQRVINGILIIVELKNIASFVLDLGLDLGLLGLGVLYGGLRCVLDHVVVTLRLLGLVELVSTEKVCLSLLIEGNTCRSVIHAEAYRWIEAPNNKTEPFHENVYKLSFSRVCNLVVAILKPVFGNSLTNAETPKGIKAVLTKECNQETF